MYSTWTRYNAFIELATGETSILKEIMKFLASQLPKERHLSLNLYVLLNLDLKS